MFHYQQNVKEVLKELGTSPKGLGVKDAKRRLSKYGKNVLGTKKSISILRIFLDQFNDPLIWVLLFAIVISLVIQHYVDAVVIAVIVVFNAAFGLFQEFKAEKAIEHLRQLRQYKAIVIRDGKRISINSDDLVLGDIIMLEEGDKIPADARIIESISLRVDEASLTGESKPVGKMINKISGLKSIGDQVNMVFSGTVVVAGKATAVVTATSHKTELGKIAKEIEAIKVGETPLQKKLKEIGKWLTIIVLGICALIFVVGTLRGLGLADMFLMAISLAVAAIPEGLPAVVTITLALGLRKMLNRKALIRKLRSVETLGSVSVICSDKTGTLTRNEMIVTKIYANEKKYDVTGIGYKPVGNILFGKKQAQKEVLTLLEVATSCNDATLELGDPTERALKVLAEKANVKEKGRVSEVPFNSDAKFMEVVGKDGTRYLKGALEIILSKCTYIIVNGKKRKITKGDLKKIQAINEQFSKEALRVLSYAVGKKELCFVGLTGMIDPPRQEVPRAIASCHKAGIRTIMITGDHLLTARAVAEKVGIKGEAIEGLELDKL
jgi:P-type Ca2+ transporter type 2C